MWELDYKESWVLKNWCFWTVVLEKTPESPLDCKEIQPSTVKEISPGCSLGGMMLKLKLHYFGHLMRRDDSLEKTDAGRDWGQEEKGMTEDEMAGWHHRLDGRESEWTPGVGDGQGGLVCCDSWGRKESDTTERLNWTELKITADGDCSHEIRRCFFCGRKAMTDLDSILKSRDITLLTKVRLVKAMVFPVVMYGCESWTISQVLKN